MPRKIRQLRVWHVRGSLLGEAHTGRVRSSSALRWESSKNGKILISFSAVESVWYRAYPVYETSAKMDCSLNRAGQSHEVLISTDEVDQNLDYQRIKLECPQTLKNTSGYWRYLHSRRVPADRNHLRTALLSPRLFMNDLPSIFVLRYFKTSSALSNGETLHVTQIYVY